MNYEECLSLCKFIINKFDFFHAYNFLPVNYICIVKQFAVRLLKTDFYKDTSKDDKCGKYAMLPIALPEHCVSYLGVR